MHIVEKMSAVLTESNKSVYDRQMVFNVMQSMTIAILVH